MENPVSPSQKFYLSVLVFIAWFAVITQFILSYNLHVNPWPEMVTRFFSYFTIDTNILVAVCCTLIVTAPNPGWGRFFSRQKTLAATTVYIVVVGLIYNIILRVLWKPEGLQWLVNELLHSVIPVMFLLFWLISAPKNNLQWKNMWAWLIYPLVYTVCIFIRGALSGFYPYPFINITTIGVQSAIINAVGLAFVFAGMSLLFIVIGRLTGKKT